MKNVKALLLLICILMGLLAATASAQEEEDNSGTNPTKFTSDFKMWLHTQSLPGDNAVSTWGFAYQKPIGSKFKATFTARIKDISTNIGSESHSTSGISDLEFKLVWLAMKNESWGFAFAFETIFNTAAKPALGAGQTLIGPQVFVAFFDVFGTGVLFAPAYKHTLNVEDIAGRPEVNRSAIDLFFVYLTPNKKMWFTFDPQAVIDHERELEFGIIDLEIGQMMFGTTSSFIRPGFGIGDDKPMDWDIEFGFKVIW